MTAYLTIRRVQFETSGVITTGPHLQVRQRHAILGIVSLGEKEVPQAEFLGFHLELLDDWNDGIPTLHWIGRQLRMGQLC